MTNLTLAEIRRLLEGKDLSPCKGSAKGMISNTLPPGALLNEIGAIFINGDNEAESDLASLFEGESHGTKCLGYFYLSQRRHELELKTLDLIIEFESDPANAETIDSIKTLIRAQSGR